MISDKPSAIRPAGENPLASGINMFLYAMPGAGKTPFIASAGKGTLIIDSDEGSKSAAGSGADVWTNATDWATLDEVYEYLRHTPDHGYKWVWWDGISIGQDKLLESIMEDLIVNRGKSHRKHYLVDKGEFQENFMRIKQWIRHMLAQPFNFGITGFPFPSEDESTGDTKLWPWVQGRNMPQAVCSAFDIIGYGKREGDDFNLYVRETEEYYARDRFGALGDGLRNPTMSQIERRIKEKLGVTSKAAAAAAPTPKKIGAKPVAKKRS